MKDNPLVSVVVPCYNHESYVEKAIISVVNQSYSNIDLIVVDDGSNDKTPDIITKLKREHNFTFLLQENVGVCRTINNAIKKHSKGKYIALLASDDYWDEKKIEKQVRKILEERDCEFCYTQAVEFDSDSGRELRVFPKKDYTGSVLNRVFFRQPYAAGTIMFTRELYNRLNGFDETLQHEDWDFSIRSASVTNFCAVQEPLFYYRSHGFNVSKTSGRRGVFQQKMKTLANNYHLVKPRVWLQSVLLHFLHDHLIYRFKILNLKRFFY